jgi:hypothetical protein
MVFFRCKRMTGVTIASILSMMVINPLHAERNMVGTVEMVDESIMRITIKPDTGETESFSVTNPYILKKVVKNDRVNVVVSNDGMVNEISKITTSDQKDQKDTTDR